MEVDDDGAYAYVNGTRVGEVTIFPPTDLDHGITIPATINQMFVDNEYQKGGIGMALIKAAFNEFGQLLPPPKEGPNAMTPEGLSLIKRAVAKGWVRDPDSDDTDVDGLV